MSPREKDRQLLDAIEAAIAAVLQDHQLSVDERRKALLVLRHMLEDEQCGGIRRRVLRGFRDICTMAVILYEDSPIDLALFELRGRVKEHYPQLDELPLLGRDFGKGDPL